MTREDISFVSDGLKLAGHITLPKGYAPGQRRPAVIVLHGFGSTKNAGSVEIPCDMLAERGYVAMGFDMRSCGASEGEKGRIICLEQVADTQAAVTYLQGRAEVDPQRIALLGSSFGAAVAVYAGSVDERVAAVVSSGGWGNGERKFRGQHAGPGEWERFTAMLEEGKRHRERTGQSLMAARFDIVPIPPALRGNLAPGSIEMFPVETAQSMFDFKAEEVVHRMAPRPLLLLHSSVDSVTPTEQSIEMFKRAGQPCDLHLFAETDHFMFAESNTRVREVLFGWLDRYFPAAAPARA